MLSYRGIGRTLQTSLFISLLTFGCTTDPVGSSPDDGNPNDLEEESPVRDAGTSSDAGKLRDAGKDDTKRPSSALDARTTTSAHDAGRDIASGASIPCDVQNILAANCSECHGAKPSFGATFSLLTPADFQAPGSSDPSRKRHELARARIHAEDPSMRMPPPSQDALSASDLAALSAWLQAGANMGEGCSDGAGNPETDRDDTERMPEKAGSGGAHARPIEYDDPDLKCYELHAFQPGDTKKPYTVPTTPDIYVTFDQKAPWEGIQYVHSFRPLIDNTEVIHHFLLFQQPSGGAERVTENAVGAHPEGLMLYGWAPGGDPLYFDPDVGMEIDGSVLYQLEMHYNNTTGAGAPDASGVEICVTPHKPVHVAGLSWLGTDAILASTTAIGRCAHLSQEPVHIIAAQPHMHLKGRNMKVEVERQAGAIEVLHDEPFSFEYQRSYLFDYIVQPGDVLHTTCTFSEPSVFGKGTNDEMCHFFTIAWPAGALTSLGVGTLVHGPAACMDI